MVVADQDTTLLFDGLKFFLAREALSPSSHYSTTSTTTRSTASTREYAVVRVRARRCSVPVTVAPHAACQASAPHHAGCVRRAVRWFGCAVCCMHVVCGGTSTALGTPAL